MMEYLLTTVHDLLKYAEGKHAVLMGFNMAVVGFVISHLSIESWSWTIRTFYFIWIIGFIFISIICSFLSYLPILDANTLTEKETLQKTNERNPFFFVDAAKMESNEFIKTLKDGGKEKKELWVANQIIVNSQIAVRKYRLFERAAWIAFYGLLPPIAFCMWMVRHLKKRRK